ncbi:hypothetical protein CASFOL_042421 [Castilleja foliolosa]|uniref:Transposase n=1 Tax=Castilleja foliolosa TaxID=1961234 RepID=A0ABD3BAQ5_9LAMI
MGDSQVNSKRKGKEKETYEAWTKEDSNELLQLIVDAIKNGMRDANGSISKLNVERVILPRLNAKIKFPKTYNHYLSRMKWFKKQYNNMSSLMRNNSGFGWDPILKTFTASDEVWNEYLKSHPSHKNFRGKSTVNYEDLKVVFDGGTAGGYSSISVDPDFTDATILGEENNDFGMESFSYDQSSGAFIAPDHYEPPFQPLSPRPSNSPSNPPIDSEIRTSNPINRKRSRPEDGGSSNSFGNNNKVLETIYVGIETIAVNFEKMSNLMEKRERDREANGTIWSAIKEVPDLDNRTRYMAADFLDTNAKKDLFLKMSIEERSDWIKCTMSHSSMYGVSDLDDEEMDVEKKDDEDIFEAMYACVMAIHALMHVLNIFLVMIRNEQIERPLNRRRITNKGNHYIHRALHDDPNIFRQVYRMYPNVFLKLCAILREKTLLEDTRYICVEEMLASFLQIVGQNTRYCVIRNTFGRSQFSTSENFHRILKALNTIAPTLMAKPGSSVPAKIKESTRLFPFFKDCIGAIDGTHIPAMVRGRDVSSYRNRHGKISQNVLAACNFDLEFMYVLSGWEGSAHDSKILNDAITRRNGLKVAQGKYFLVDCGFPNRRQFLAPFRGVRYHLQDFAGQGNDPVNEKELFNLRHASLRNVIERIFGIFKSRFTIFKTAPPFLYNTQAELVLACAALHNFLRKECRSDEFPIEPVDEPSSSTLPVNGHNFEPIVQTQEQERQDANVWRTSIAMDMWMNAP